MQHSLLIQLDKHPQERDLIGKLILAYGELEFMLLDMVRATLGENHDEDPNTTVTAVRILYRLRSEANRLSVADAIIRPKMAAHDLLKPYCEAFQAIFACKNIRNRYAHGQFVSIKGHLRIGDLDAVAKTTGPEVQINFQLLTLEHLKKEFEYFAYAEHTLIHATNQLRLKTGQKLPLGAVIPKPQKIPAPKLGNRPKVRSPQGKKKA
ncbi:hypothetical protein [Sphingomonas sp.]|uniref:hypothetical protein n=1 Tax=Sphingomonas sp. TaxID=28214 RepID=UPI0025F825CA|nr:hypothetical protein [Sphingomonas sp.]